MWEVHKLPRPVLFHFLPGLVQVLSYTCSPLRALPASHSCELLCTCSERQVEAMHTPKRTSGLDTALRLP